MLTEPAALLGLLCVSVLLFVVNSYRAVEIRSVRGEASALWRFCSSKGRGERRRVEAGRQLETSISKAEKRVKGRSLFENSGLAPTPSCSLEG